MRQNDGEIGQAVRAARSTKTTGNFSLTVGAIVFVVSLFWGPNGDVSVIGAVLLLAGIALRVSSNFALNRTIWRLAFGAVGQPVPKPSQVPSGVQRELNMMFQLSVAEYAATGFAVPLDDVFARIVRERASL